MSGVARRRTLVELAMVRQGERLNASALARELGVSRGTVLRDMAAARERWATLQEATAKGLDAERARTAAVLEAVAAQAWEQYVKAAQEKGKEQAATRWLKMIMEAQIKRARLLGLEAEAAPIVVRREPIPPLEFVLAPSREDFETEEEYTAYFMKEEGGHNGFDRLTQIDR